MQIRAALGLIAVSVLVFGCSPQPASCQAPIAPATVDGSTATELQMAQAHETVVRFQKQSDDYQTCLVNAINEYRKNPPFFSRFYDDGYVADAEKRTHDNQLEKERVVSEFNGGARVYNSMHP